MAELYESSRSTTTGRASGWRTSRPTPSPWTTSDFVRAAGLLGELAGRRPLDSDCVLGARPMYRTPGLALAHVRRGPGRRAGRSRHPADERVGRDPDLERPRLTTDAASSHPRATGADRSTPARRLDALPQTYAHGDASPQNLLGPGDEPGSSSSSTGASTPRRRSVSTSVSCWSAWSTTTRWRPNDFRARATGRGGLHRGTPRRRFRGTYDDVPAGYALSLVVATCSRPCRSTCRRTRSSGRRSTRPTESV